MSTLYIVGTPIGNLEDITFRAIEVLRKVDFILAEDTRKTKILLNYYKIKKPLISYFQHSKLSKVDYILNLLRERNDLALVTEAGTPGISDPGNKLVDMVWEEKKRNANINIVPIPGVSAVTAILSICGFKTDDFLFLGFLPKKKGRRMLFRKLEDENRTIVLFESPYRVIRTLEDIKNYLGNVDIVIGRELTKKFEEIKQGNISEMIEYFGSKKVKGEFVIAFKKKP